jgi:hypothetical protein
MGTSKASAADHQKQDTTTQINPEIPAIKSRNAKSFLFIGISKVVCQNLNFGRLLTGASFEPRSL